MLILKSEIKARAHSVNPWSCSFRYQNQTVLRNCFSKILLFMELLFALHFSTLQTEKLFFKAQVVWRGRMALSSRRCLCVKETLISDPDCPVVLLSAFPSRQSSCLRNVLKCLLSEMEF